MSLALGVCSALGGCQVNMVLLEMLGAKGPSGYYALTFLHYVTVAVLSVPQMMRWRRPEEEPTAAVSVLTPCRLRPQRLRWRHKAVLAAVSWAVTVGNNVAFGLNLSVPVHATCRSSSLLVNMLCGYLLLGRRFTLPQVLAAATVCVGLVTLTVQKARQQQVLRVSNVMSPAAEQQQQQQQAADVFRWVCGVSLLMGTTLVMAVMSIFQEHVFRSARERAASAARRPRGGRAPEEAPPPLWGEALFFSHALGIPFFLTQPQRLVEGLGELRSASAGVLLGSCVTQFVCIAGVFVLSSVTSAFGTALVLALRKLLTFFFSVLAFQHYRYLGYVEWLAMLAALAAATAYPFLPRAPPR